MDEYQRRALLALIRLQLESFSKDKLLELIVKAAQQSPDFLEDLQKLMHLDFQNFNPVEFFLGKNHKIESVLNYETAINNEQDYHRVSHYCSDIINETKILLESKKADEIVKILVNIIIFFMDCSDSEEDYLAGYYRPKSKLEDQELIYDKILNNIHLFIDAIEQSSLNTAEKLFLALNCQYHSNYLIEDFKEYVDQDYPKEIWSEVAEFFLKVLNGDYVSYVEWDLEDQESLIGLTVEALQKSERTEDIKIVCENGLKKLCENDIREFDQMMYFVFLEYLIEIKAYALAEKYVKLNSPYAAEHKSFVLELHEYLLKIKTAQQDWETLLILQIEDFVDKIAKINIDKYFACKDSAEKLSIWPEVRTSLLNYLEKGELPWEQACWPKVLAANDLKPLALEQIKRDFPDYKLLLDVVLQENDCESVDYYYELYKNDPKLLPYLPSLNAAVAKAISTCKPEKSIAMLKSIAEDCMLHVKNRYYNEAVSKFKDVKEVMLANNLEQEWISYFNSIKDKHKRKTNFIKLANSLLS